MNNDYNKNTRIEEGGDRQISGQMLSLKPKSKVTEICDMSAEGERKGDEESFSLKVNPPI